MERLSSLAKKLTEQNGTEVVTAVCEIFRNLGKERRESVGQGCLVQTKQSNECCVVTADKVIPNGQLDTFEVEFTRGDSKLKRFFLKDIKKNIDYNSGLVIIVIDLESVQKQHKKKTWSMFTKAPLTVTALEESKKQICYTGKKCFNVIVSRNSTIIEFPDHTPPTIPNGLVILQTASNSTDNDVVAIGIQCQVDGNPKIIWMNKILGKQDPSASLTTMAPDPPMSEPPNPGSTGDTASNQTPTNGGDQQSLNATADAHKPGNEPQTPVLNNGTAVDDNTDDSHISPTCKEDSADSAVCAVGGADHNFKIPKGAYKLETDPDGNEEEVLQTEGNQGFKSHRHPSAIELSFLSIQEPASTSPLQEIYNSVSWLDITDGKGNRGSTLDNAIPLGKQQVELHEGYGGEGRRHSYPYHVPKKEEQYNMKRCFSEATMKKRKIKLGTSDFENSQNRQVQFENLNHCEHLLIRRRLCDFLFIVLSTKL